MCCSAGDALAHCQVPCGIYDDGMRLSTIAEHITTIERSITAMTELDASDPESRSQLVRWVSNRDEHAEAIQRIVADYFLTQRVTPFVGRGSERDAYVLKLTLLHEMLVTAMKTKQSLDLSNVERLRALLKEFRAAYYGAGMSPGKQG